jgi:hypothetical protein
MVPVIRLKSRKKFEYSEFMVDIDQLVYSVRYLEAT